MIEISQINETEGNLRIFCIGSESFFSDQFSHADLKDKIIIDKYKY